MSDTRVDTEAGRDDEPIVFNPLQPGYVEDPAPHLAELRERDPVHWSLMEQWMLFRYDDVFRLLRDPAMSVDDRNVTFKRQGRQDLFTTAFTEAYGRPPEPSTSILVIDPPDHTRLRRLVSKAFTPSAIEALRPRVQEMVDDICDRIEQRGGGDVVAELAFPLPFDVISEMLGMPEADTAQVAEWSSALVKTLDPVITDDEIRDAAFASKHIDDLIEEVIAWKRSHPAPDLLTALIEAEEGGDRLSTKELRDQVRLLFVAGHETTVNLIGTGIFELLRHPDQWRLLESDPSLDANAVDELLRFVSPVQFSFRVTMRDVEFGGRTIERGHGVLTGLASANRDPAKWGPTADDLDIRREGAGQHVSFGSGAHYCLGSSLARLEAQVAVGTFVRRFPRARVVGEPVWNGRINLRGLEHLHVEV